MIASATRPWIDEFVMELRERHIRGSAIGDAVAAVESHCQDSGESPEEAFGPAREYARSLEFNAADIDRTTTRQWLRLLTPVAAGLGGFWFVTASVGALMRHQETTVTWGAIASCLVLAVWVGVVAWRLAVIARHPVLGGLFLAVGLVVMVLTSVLFTAVVAAVPTMVGLTLGAVLLALSVVLGYRWKAIGDDPVVAPLDTDAGRSRARMPRAFAVMTGPWAFVVWTLVMSALLWVMQVLGGN